MIHERNHLFGERPIALGLLRIGRSAHPSIIDIVYYRVKAFLDAKRPVDSAAPVENVGRRDEISTRDRQPFPTGAWKTLRVFHTDHRPDNDG